MTDQPPAAAGEDSIAAIPRTPTSVFVHWRLEGPRSAEAVRAAGEGAEWVLRVVDLTDGASRTAVVRAEDGSRYLELRPGRPYGFELALRGKGRWRTVCRTGRVEMPPALPTPPAERPGPVVASAGIPGLHADSTALALGSSPGVTSPGAPPPAAPRLASPRSGRVS